MTDSGRGGAVLTGLDRETCRNLLAPILAKGVESALVGQDGVPLVPLLRDAAQRASNASSPWAQQLPGLLPVEVATIIHWACLDIERAHTLIRDFEGYRDLAMQGEDPLEAGGISAENAVYTYDATTEFYREHRDLLGVEVPFVEIFAPAWLLVYSGLFEGVPVCPPYIEPLYLKAR